MADMLNYNLAVPDVDDAGVLSALVAEGDELDVLVRAVDDWSVPTPAPGWTVAHQIAHLAWADANALSALRTPDAFGAELGRAEAEGSGYADKAAAAGAAKPRSVLLDEWRAGRTELAAALRDTPWDHAFPWLFVAGSVGPTPTSMLAPLGVGRGLGGVVNLAPTSCFGPTPIGWVP
ncbi:maleylpyruvate isomerase N-terminal domain-containing protein [Streptomyces sp. NPDC052036]|uniref:maleylpyruvate isomerase N-terminal domain-containing protein n=1 Tax=Streptomyces sp. NPDC052036 TaxID=3155171 RepID=UPI0034288DF4